MSQRMILIVISVENIYNQMGTGPTGSGIPNVTIYVLMIRDLYTKGVAKVLAPA
jgi:hypothetical protein